MEPQAPDLLMKPLERQKEEEQAMRSARYLRQPGAEALVLGLGC